MKMQWDVSLACLSEISCFVHAWRIWFFFRFLQRKIFVIQVPFWGYVRIEFPDSTNYLFNQNCFVQEFDLGSERSHLNNDLKYLLLLVHKKFISLFSCCNDNIILKWKKLQCKPSQCKVYLQIQRVYNINIKVASF